MRVFTAIKLPLEVKNELYRVQKLINPGLAKIKWVPKKNLHLTLKFIGDVDNFEEIHDKLKGIEIIPFLARLGDFGTFPNLLNVKVLWADLVPHKKIIELQQEIDSELLGFTNEYQMFSPHLTLGRIKKIKKVNEFHKLIRNDISIKPIEFEVNSFQLMQSKLSKDGSKDIVLKEYKS